MRQRRPEAPPVFLDRSGRRRRLVAMVGACFGVGLVAMLAILLASVFGTASIHIPGFPDAAVPQGNGVDTTPKPTPANVARTPPPTAPTTSGRPSPTPTGTASTSATKPGHVPTQTPPHPTKSR